MRDYLKPHIITAILAIIFCICGHVFMTAYTNFNITQKKLELLRSQERFFKARLKGLEEKTTVIAQTKVFIDDAGQAGLFKKNWDEFSVDLKDEPISFPQLKTILFQASTTGQYYFIPESLVIQLGSIKKPDEKKEAPKEIKGPPVKTPPPAPQTSDIPNPVSDAVIRLKGVFLVPHGRQDE